MGGRFPVRLRSGTPYLIFETTPPVAFIPRPVKDIGEAARSGGLQGDGDVLHGLRVNVPDPDDLESTLLAHLETKTGKQGNTTVAFCLAT